MRKMNFKNATPACAFCVVGANTGVGKTLVSAGLAAGFRVREKKNVRYVKPWQTGAPQDSDERTVRQAVAWREESENPLGARGVDACTLVAYRAPVSPHVAARYEGLPKRDAEVVKELEGFLAQQGDNGVCLLEGAGGVASPTPEGALQCDVLRPLGVPVVLVGCSKLGGISATLVALESLLSRGFAVAAIVFLGHDEGPGNACFVAETLEKRRLGVAQEFESPVPAVAVVGPAQGVEVLGLEPWLAQSTAAFDALAASLLARHSEATDRVGVLSERGSELVWWPFTQHGLPGRVGVIESASGDNMVFSAEGPLFDACASWWTQSLGHGRDDLAREAATAAGRFGHVMFPGNVHEPAVTLAKALLDSVGKGWADRVFYSDNGSTAAEVALKMAFRLTLTRQGNANADGRRLRVLGLKDSYHGDTLGAMDAASPNVFNAREPWYTGRGVWWPFPVVSLQGAAWSVSFGGDFAKWCEPAWDPDAPGAQGASRFNSREALFSPERLSSPLARFYERSIRAQFGSLDSSEFPLGALLLEPVVHGSGGMLFVDPLFQSVLAREAKARGIPVVFDEVFVGFWRLGFARAADAIGVLPDVACYSKGLTGGLAPLGATLATEEVFRCFLGDSKADALLHGHSFTAYPMGCAISARAVGAMQASARVRAHAQVSAKTPWAPFCVFPEEGLARLAAVPGVSRVWALGTVFAGVWGGDTGYTGTAAAALVKKLRERGVYARTLGNVFYGMATLETPDDKASWLLESYTDVLRQG